MTQLNRTISLWPLVLFGIAYVSPFIVLTTAGSFSEIAQGALPSAYLLTTVAMIFTAFSYAKMARLYPSAGSAYTYARKTLDSRIGFMVGWVTLLDYFFLPMVVWLIGTAYLTSAFPAVPAWVFLTAFIGLTTAINIIGVKVATKVNIVLISFQLLVIALFIIFTVVSISNGQIYGAEPEGFTVGSLFAPFWNSGTSLTAITAGAAVAAYSFIGFDAVSTFAEETVDPRKTVPKAIILTALIAGVLFATVAYFFQLGHPGYAFEDPDSAPLQMAKTIGGNFFGAVFLATVIMTQFTAGIPIQSAGARLMYAMGRDGVLPRAVFGRISQKTQTPVINILLTGAIGFIALALTVSSSTSFINFGAFVAFAFVNISVIGQFIRDRNQPQNTNTAKRSGLLHTLSWVVQPAIGLAVIIYLMAHLDGHALLLGGIWAALGLIWLLVITRGFRHPTPQAELEDA